MSDPSVLQAPAAKQQEREIVKQALNQNQIIYKLSKPKETQKPMLSNAWAHAEAKARCLKEDRLPNLLYKDEYLEILCDINEKNITYEDMQNPMTPTDEYYADIILEGVMVKRQNQALKQTVISPELSMNSIVTHARNQILNAIWEYKPASWRHENKLWSRVTGKKQLTCTLTWPWQQGKVSNYLNMTIKYGVEIDMTDYPGGRLIESKYCNAAHLGQALGGWKGGRIKWVRLMASQVEKKREQLEALMYINE
ncbi:uncharacterized protein EI90DRAFT_3010775 [Cantharellus anzutake]|uniref:uncharacterized protein n=1 Tax=Cantharellus anzutake TaxID=1750568 RepID=UPI001902EEFF|nr:uncharacterized protein EI90DRAFT_3010775 [Cantharellus anzutake]KAF8343920.1 hypothetical protein EI90DRAFT_3010775 [Cantharellus anzutake]